MYGPKSIWVILLSSPRLPFPSALGPCSSLCLGLPYGPSFWLSRPTKVSASVYTCRADTAVAFYKVSRADRRESCTASSTTTSFTDLYFLFPPGLNFVLQFLITRRRVRTRKERFYQEILARDYYFLNNEIIFLISNFFVLYASRVVCWLYVSIIFVWLSAEFKFLCFWFYRIVL